MPKYNRFKYGEALYGSVLNFTDHVRVTGPSTDYVKVTGPSSDWNEQDRHTYGAIVGTSTRATYGENIRYGGTAKIEYKFISSTPHYTDY